MLPTLNEDHAVWWDDGGAVLANQKIILRGVVFGRSVRSSFATIHVARLPVIQGDGTSPMLRQDNTVQRMNQEDDDDEEQEPVLIRMQFMSDQIALRSYCRRFCKLGDLLEVVVESPDEKSQSTTLIEWQSPEDSVETEWQAPRLVVHVDNTVHAESTVQVVQRHYWSIPKCQQWQRQYIPVTVPVIRKKKGRPRQQDHGDDAVEISVNGPPLWMDQPCAENCCGSHHGGGLGKRTQGEYIASFLLHMMSQKMMMMQKRNDGTRNTDIFSDSSTWAQQDILKEGSQTWIKGAVAMLNQGAGVFDVAGGSGHVSMALGMIGVRSTVVDPRENVGKLPKRDRKIFQRAMKRKLPSLSQPTELQATAEGTPRVDGATNENGAAFEHLLYCQPVAVPFDSLRAWFGAPPVGVDESFRHPDQETVSVVGSDRISTCSAIVALHPDEATDAIVDTAVRLRVPFVIVPCCVFNRLFPSRRKPTKPDEPVSTYQDLLEYLMAKDESIQKTTLPFEGANTILWSYF
jgi:hypothetical protein